MLNSSIIQGRITRDPELKHTDNGNALTNFSLAVERDFKDKSGERPTDFIDCTVWGKTAELVCSHVSKGQMVTVEGRIQTGKYTDKEGVERKSFKISAAKVYFTFDNKPAAPDGFTQYDGDEDIDGIFG